MPPVFLPGRGRDALLILYFSKPEAGRREPQIPLAPPSPPSPSSEISLINSATSFQFGCRLGAERDQTWRFFGSLLASD